MTEERVQRELWRNRWLSCINELTSLKIQQDFWLEKKNSSPHWSFIESMCCYFDDLGIDDSYECQLKSNLITKNEFESIRNWHELLGNYVSPNNDDTDHYSILRDEKWLNIVNEGLMAISELRKFLNKKEIEILVGEVHYTSH